MEENWKGTVWMRLWFQDMDCLEGLPEAECWQVIKALRHLAETGEESTLQGAAQIAYRFMSNRIMQDCANYSKTCERNRANGKKRKPSGKQENPAEPSGTQWDSEEPSGGEVRSKKKEVRSKKIEDRIDNTLPHSGSSDSKKKRENDPEMNSRFDSFWSEYPRKEAKQEARKAFFALAPDEVTLARMLEAVKKQKTGEQWRDRQFIPHPATWIRGKRWEDEGSTVSRFQNLGGMINL